MGAASRRDLRPVGAASRRDLRSPSVFLTGIALILVVLAGMRIGQSALGVRDVIAVLVGSAAVVVLVLAERGIRIGFLLWIWMFALGDRAIHLNADLDLHPLALFIASLFAIVLVRRVSLGAPARSWPLPRLLRILSPFWLWGWAMGIIQGTSGSAMLSEAAIFALWVPVFVLVAYIFDSDSGWRSGLLALYGVGTLIALLGLLDLVIPDASRLLPIPAIGEAQLGPAVAFQRASFAIWGSPVATFISALALPMVLPLWQWFKAPLARGLLALALVLQILGIYVGGFRSVWAIVAVGALVILVLRLRWAGVVWGAAGAAGLYLVLPETGQARLLSLGAALQGNFQDTSSLDRWERALNAFSTIVGQPWGVGWAGSGWVHSDFLQVAGNLGIVAGVLFALWYLTTLIAILRLQRQQPGDPLVLALAGAFVVAGGLLAVEGVEVLAQTALPVWFVWALVEVKLWNAESALRPGAAPELHVRG